MAMLFTLDLATTTGFCWGAGDETPALGHVKMPDTKEDVGRFLDFFYRWMHLKVTDIMAEMGPELETTPGPYGAQLVNRKELIIVFEAPVLPRAKLDTRPGRVGALIQAPVTIQTTRKLQGLAGVAEMVAVQRNCVIEEVYNATIKKGLGGFGGADKDDMVTAAKRAGMNPKVHDEADAFGIWIVVMRTYAKQYQHLWDQRLYGNRRLA